jgi:D-alanyl-D-alanine carboxypeptidase (penicillin-binding protein 5/6)
LSAWLIAVLSWAATYPGSLIAAPPQVTAGQAPASPAGKAAVKAPVSGETLRVGDTGPAVEDLQRRLNDRLKPSPELDVDGDFGPVTRAAVIRFQHSEGLEETGNADPKTRRALGKEAVKEPEIPAPEVVNAQRPRRRSPDPLDGPPFVTAKAWAVVDGRNGEVLWGENATEPRDMASTTKLMTALVVLRLASKAPKVLDEVVTFSEQADKTTGSTAGVRAGERLPVRELLFGLLLPSGNDAAVALAEHFGGRLEPAADAPDQLDPLSRFAAEMNRVATELGLRETHFTNPHGLTDPRHRSSARDLANLARRALAEPVLAACVATAKHGCTLVNKDGQRRNVLWTNSNRLLEIEGYDGVKTGTTEAAGACLVASGRRKSDHLIIVVLGSSSSDARYTEARNLFRWAWLKRGHGEGVTR